MNIIDVRLNVFREFCAVLQRDLIFCSIFCTRNLNDVRMDRITRAIQVLNKLGDTALVLKITTFSISLIMKLDVHTTVEKSEFLQSFVEGVKVILGDTENLVVCLERGLGARLFCCPALGNRTCGHSTFIFLCPSEPISADFHFRPLAQEIDYRHTHTMQTARGLVRTFLKLPTKF